MELHGLGEYCCFCAVIGGLFSLLNLSTGKAIFCPALLCTSFNLLHGAVQEGSHVNPGWAPPCS